MVRSKLKELSNIYFDMFDIISNINENEHMDVNLRNWLKEHDLTNSSFTEIGKKFKEFIEDYEYKVVYIKDITFLTEMPIGDDVGKFFIIKHEDKYLKAKSNKPLTIYVDKDSVGMIIGKNGSNINRVRNDLNIDNVFWNIPYINVKKFENRPTNNNIKEVNKKFLQLLDNIF